MTTMQRLLVFFRGSWRMVALAVSLGWATTISWVALISTSAYLISYAALHPSVAELQVAIVGVRFFGIARAVFRYLERLVSHTVTFQLLAKMRTWLYEKIEPLVPAGLEDQNTSELYTRLAGDIETLQEFYIRVIAPPLVAILSILLVLWFLGRWSVEMALLLLFFQILTGIVTPLVVRRLGASSSREIGKGHERLAKLVVDSVQGSAEIQAFGLQERFTQDFIETQNRLNDAEKKQNLIMGGHAAMVGLGINLAALLILVTAIPLVSQGELDGRLLAVVVLGALASFEAIIPLPAAFQNLDESLQVGEEIFELADRRTEIEENGKKKIAPGGVDLEIRNLSFAYSQYGESVLCKFNLDLPAGKRIAVIGPSGAGKTTIINLLLRFWRFDQGEILINGIDIREFGHEEVRGVFSYVPQNPFIFNASLAENIRIGKPNATLAEIEAAVELAGLREFVTSLPTGYDTLAGEFGVMLSGGQRQRLALARALVRSAPIFLLDEPTENLDPGTAEIFISSLLENLSGKSLLMITHQFYGLDKMDEILVMQDSRVVEQGGYQEMISKSGRLAELIALNRSNLI